MDRHGMNCHICFLLLLTMATTAAGLMASGRLCHVFGCAVGLRMRTMVAVAMISTITATTMASLTLGIPQLLRLSLLVHGR